jgi:choline dehydrogenase-like flavoprotein
MRVSESRAMTPLADVMVEAARAAGHEHNPDFNGARQEGVGRFQLTQRGGMRESTADAFLRPATDRPNLDVITRAMATRILFDGRRATGVEIFRDACLQELRADREVILSAGAFQSPLLLMLSGIGPVDQLEPLGIEVREALPVGENLQDHPMVNLNFLADEGSLFGAASPENFALLESEGRGPLTSNIPEAAGFFRTRPGLEGPDVELHFAPSMLYDGGLTAPEAGGVAFGPVVVHPSSRGRVMLRAPLPDSKPRVLCKFLTTDEDWASMLAGMRMALEIAEQEPLRSTISGSFRVPKSDSEEDLRQFVRDEAMTVFHPTSTCSIGPVLDPELRVHGFEALRVIDASAMPIITRANTNAATIMIAERGADLIRGAGDP